jgi:hypothetical protein
VIFAGVGAGQQGITAPHRPGNDFRAAIGQFPRHLRKETVLTDHHPDLAKPRFNHRVVTAGSDARVNFTARQANFAVFVEELAIRANKRGDVIDQMPVAFEQADLCLPAS